MPDTLKPCTSCGKHYNKLLARVEVSTDFTPLVEIFDLCPDCLLRTMKALHNSEMPSTTPETLKCPICGSGVEVHDGEAACTNDPVCPLACAVYPLEKWLEMSERISRCITASRRRAPSPEGERLVEALQDSDCKCLYDDNIPANLLLSCKRCLTLTAYKEAQRHD